MENLKGIVKMYNEKISDTNYSLDVYEYGDNLVGLQLYWRGGLLSNLITKKDSRYIAEVFLLNLDKFLLFNINENK